MQHVPIRLPEIVSADDECRFGQWLVDDGDSVLAGDRVAEILTRGVLVYVASPAEGTLIQRVISSGRPLSTGESIGEIVTNAEEPAGN